MPNLTARRASHTGMGPHHHLTDWRDGTGLQRPDWTTADLDLRIRIPAHWLDTPALIVIGADASLVVAILVFVLATGNYSQVGSVIVGFFGMALAISTYAHTRRRAAHAGQADQDRPYPSSDPDQPLSCGNVGWLSTTHHGEVEGSELAALLSHLTPHRRLA